MRSSPDAQYALHIGYHQGVFSACLFWLVASFTASYFGVWASWVKWAMVVLRLVYLLRPKYIDHYPTVDPRNTNGSVIRFENGWRTMSGFRNCGSDYDPSCDCSAERLVGLNCGG